MRRVIDTPQWGALSLSFVRKCHSAKMPFVAGFQNKMCNCAISANFAKGYNMPVSACSDTNRQPRSMQRIEQSTTPKHPCPGLFYLLIRVNTHPAISYTPCMLTIHRAASRSSQGTCPPPSGRSTSRSRSWGTATCTSCGSTRRPGSPRPSCGCTGGSQRTTSSSACVTRGTASHTTSEGSP